MIVILFVCNSCQPEHFWYILNTLKKYYLSEWECYFFHCNLGIIRWCLFMFIFTFFLDCGKKVHENYHLKFLSVQCSIFNYKYNVLQQISWTFSLYITETLYPKQFCEENNLWVRKLSTILDDSVKFISSPL